MIKLETTRKSPRSAMLFAIESSSAEAPSIILSTEPANKRNAADTAWEIDPAKRKQYLSFISADGDPCQLVGNVPEGEAIEIEAAYKVVAQCEVNQQKTGAREAGGFSRDFYGLKLLRVIEVWETPTKCLWRATDAPKPGKEFNAQTGKIGQAA
jgi:hypothetical protein